MDNSIPWEYFSQILCQSCLARASCTSRTKKDGRYTRRRGVVVSTDPMPTIITLSLTIVRTPILSGCGGCRKRGKQTGGPSPVKGSGSAGDFLVTTITATISSSKHLKLPSLVLIFSRPHLHSSAHLPHRPHELRSWHPMSNLIISNPPNQQSSICPACVSFPASAFSGC